MDETDTQAVEQEAPEQDTAETQQSEASKSDKEAPEATQEAVEQKKETTKTEVEAEDTAEEKLFAGKYKSVDELEKAYKNAESQLGKVNSEKSQLGQELSQSLTAEGETIPDQVVRKVAALEFTVNHPDADGQEMVNVLTTDPIAQQIQGYEAKLEYAYLKSQNVASSKAAEEARKVGQQEATAKVAEKQAAQVEGSRSAEQVDEAQNLLNQATSGTPEERKAARLELLRKNIV